MPLTTSFDEAREVEGWDDCAVKDDAAGRPVYVSPGGRIYLESFHPLQAEATEFLLAVSEPVARAGLVHEFQLTVVSIFAAVALRRRMN